MDCKNVFDRLARRLQIIMREAINVYHNHPFNVLSKSAQLECFACHRVVHYSNSRDSARCTGGDAAAQRPYLTKIIAQLVH
jgi:hypothetical protein